MTVGLVIVLLMMGVLLYAWVIYPLAMRARPRPPGPVPSGTDLPAVAVVLSAHNEESVIERRLENLAALDYPSDKLRVYVGVDGGTDATARMAGDWALTHAGVRVLVTAQNRGKAAMLKDLVELGAEPVLALTDANTLFDRDAVRRLVAVLDDPHVGGVCGRLVFRRACEAGTGETSYWDWETDLKQKESDLDSCLGANGAIYAVRRDLFWRDLPANTIIDDFVIGMKVREQGRRFVYEPAARASEDLPATVKDEWRRRVRIGAGAFQALALCRRCLSPGFGRFAWAFWSHKVLRWFTPHLLLLLSVVSFMLLCGGSGWTGGRFHAWPAALVTLMLGAGVAGRLCRESSSRLVRPFVLAHYFLVMQAALFVGFLRFCRGNLSGTWQRTERRGE